MTSPLERAARAIYAAQRGFDIKRDVLNPSAPPKVYQARQEPWESLAGDKQEWITNQARAVLAAIREPSDQYVTDVVNGAEDVIAWGDYKEFWQAMIDAALEEG